MSAPKPEAGVKPFIGLRPFARTDARWFFGREEQIGALLARLEDRRFLAVIGASGSGKSSLVRAGLLPALERGLLSGAEGPWDTVEMRPGDDPLGSLAEALHAASPQPETTRALVPHVLAMLRTGPLGALDALRQLGLGADGRPVLILVDQFEEIFRYPGTARETSPDPTPGAGVSGSGFSPAFAAVVRTTWRWFGFDNVLEDLTAAQAEGKAADRAAAVTQRETETVGRAREDAAALVGAMLALAGRTDRQVYVVLTMRSDFVGHCDRFPGLSEAVSENQYLVPRLTRRQMEQAVRGPSMRVGVEVEGRLVAEAINAAGTDPDALPLLQHALLRTWDEASRRAKDEGGERPSALTWDDYVRAGQFADALSQDAESAYRKLDAERQRVAEVMFRSLCRQDPEGPLVRRVATVGEVASRAKCRPATVIDTVRVFRSDDRNFLLMKPGSLLDEPPVGEARSGLIDISHEALLRRWTRLRDWIREESRAIDFYRYLSDKAGEWARRPKYTTLLRPPDLQRSIAWLKEYGEVPEWAERHRPKTFRRSCFYIRFSAFWHGAFWLGVWCAALLVVGLVAALGWEIYQERNDARRERDKNGQLLQAEEAQRRAKEKALQEAEIRRTENQRLLMRNWAGVIGLGSGLPRVEANALWEIAMLKPEDEALRTNLWEVLGEDDDARRRLVDRFPLVFRAAVGLEGRRGTGVYGAVWRRGSGLSGVARARLELAGAATASPEAVDPWLGRIRGFSVNTRGSLPTNTWVLQYASPPRLNQIAERLFQASTSRRAGLGLVVVEPDASENTNRLTFLLGRLSAETLAASVRRSFSGQNTNYVGEIIRATALLTRDLRGNPASEVVLTELLSEFRKLPPVPWPKSADRLAALTEASDMRLPEENRRIGEALLEAVRKLPESERNPNVIAWCHAPGFESLAGSMSPEATEFFAREVLRAFRAGTPPTRVSLAGPLALLGARAAPGTSEEVATELEGWIRERPDAGPELAQNLLPAEALHLALRAPAVLARSVATALLTNQTHVGGLAFGEPFSELAGRRPEGVEAVVEVGLTTLAGEDSNAKDGLLALLARLSLVSSPAVQERVLAAVGTRVSDISPAGPGLSECLYDWVIGADATLLGRRLPEQFSADPSRWVDILWNGGVEPKLRTSHPSAWSRPAPMRPDNVRVLAESLLGVLGTMPEPKRAQALDLLEEAAATAPSAVATRIVDRLLALDTSDWVAHHEFSTRLLARLSGNVDPERAAKAIDRVLDQTLTWESRGVIGELAYLQSGDPLRVLMQTAVEKGDASVVRLVARLGEDRLAEPIHKRLVSHDGFAEDWVALAEKAPAESARRMCQMFVEAWSDESDYPEPPMSVEEAYRQSQLEPTEVLIRAAALDVAVADRVARAMVLRIPFRTPTSDARIAGLRMKAMLAAAGRVESVALSRRLVACAFGGVLSGEVEPREIEGDESMRHHAARAVARLSAAEILEMLKFPTAIGWIERVLVEGLERHAGGVRFDGDLWAAVAWARRQPGPEVAAPPRRPSLPTIDEKGAWILDAGSSEAARRPEP